MPPIVLINASVVEAPAPSFLQETGAMISQGATTLAPGTYSLLTQSGTLAGLLAAPLAISALVWSAGTVVVTTAAAIPGLNTGDEFITTIAGATPSAYNGTVWATVTGTNTFTYALALNPGAETIPGTFTPANQGELVAMNNTYWSQGSGQAVYVLELGPGDQTNGPAALGTWIAANSSPQFFYSYLVPRCWDASAGLLALIAQFETPTSKTYFFVTTTTGTYAAAYTGVMKDGLAEVEAPNLALTEFTLAADFQHTLNYNPSSTNRMTPNSFAYLYGVTPYPTQGNGSLFAALQAANINYVGTGAEGGLSNTILFWGTTLDGNDFGWWYAADWVQIQCDLNTANAVIAGSQNKVNPLVYDQDGINRLQDVTVNTVGTGISYGLLTGTVAQTTLAPAVFQSNLEDGAYAGQNVVNAVPFGLYTQQNPSDYAIGRYAGLTVVAIPQNGFKQIVFNVLITNLVGSL
jgi:hypothetical protein